MTYFLLFQEETGSYSKSDMMPKNICWIKLVYIWQQPSFVWYKNSRVFCLPFTDDDADKLMHNRSLHITLECCINKTDRVVEEKSFCLYFVPTPT